MDKKPLNTNEQKDMSEFFTDLVSNLEECVPCEQLQAPAQSQMRPGHADFLRHTMRYLFNGVITNLVLSLDCPHVSRSFEECYTIRCQAIGVRTLDVLYAGLCAYCTLHTKYIHRYFHYFLSNSYFD